MYFPCLEYRYFGKFLLFNEEIEMRKNLTFFICLTLSLISITKASSSGTKWSDGSKACIGKLTNFHPLSLTSCTHPSEGPLPIEYTKISKVDDNGGKIWIYKVPTENICLTYHVNSNQLWNYTCIGDKGKWHADDLDQAFVDIPIRSSMNHENPASNLIETAHYPDKCIDINGIDLTMNSCRTLNENQAWTFSNIP
jgi:hypothetical protein